MLTEMASITAGVGVRIRCFGDARVGEFALGLPGGTAAHVTVIKENTMRFDELVQDIDTLLAQGGDNVMEEETGTINIDQLPLRLLVEVGQAHVEIGLLRQLKAGDILPAGGHFTPEVTLRLNGRVVGRGELVASGHEFLVRITYWYCH